MGNYRQLGTSGVVATCRIPPADVVCRIQLVRASFERLVGADVKFRGGFVVPIRSPEGAGSDAMLLGPLVDFVEDGEVQQQTQVACCELVEAVVCEPFAGIWSNLAAVGETTAPLIRGARRSQRSEAQGDAQEGIPQAHHQKLEVFS